jgi:hypothetical protein
LRLFPFLFVLRAVVSLQQSIHSMIQNLLDDLQPDAQFVHARAYSATQVVGSECRFDLFSVTPALEPRLSAGRRLSREDVFVVARQRLQHV